MRIRSLVAALAVALMTGSARADYSFVFTDTSGNASNAFTVAQGSTVTIDVYLVQNGSGSSNVLNNPGVLQTGVALLYSTTAPFSTSSGQITGNSAFSSNSSSGTTSVGGTTYNYGAIQNVSFSPVTVPSGTNQILLGAFTFTGNSVGTDVAFTALPDPTGANNVDANGNNLDSLISGATAAITVTAVPEPGTMVLVGMLATGITGCYVRRIRRKNAAVA